MASLVVLIAIALYKLPRAGALSYPTSNRACAELMLPVSVTAHNAIYDIGRVDNNIESGQFSDTFSTWDAHAGQPILRNTTISDTFNISAQLCVPPNGAEKTSLQIATHGLAFDKRYWDVTVNPSEYSYVDAALAAGYSILTYDRLGTGLSDKPDAYTIVQAPLELEILRGIIEQARSGELLQHATNTSSSNNTTLVPKTTFNKIISVGHSFGSILTSALLTTYPHLIDAAVLTGFIPNSQFANMSMTTLAQEYAPANDAALFGDRGSGYMVSGTRTALQAGFFSTLANASAGTGGFDPALLEYAFGIRQTTTVGEWISAGALDVGAAPEFKGPLQFVLAEFDFLSCRGDCKGTYSPAALKMQYPNVRDLDIYLQRGTGHGLTMHYGAMVGYRATFDWLDGNGF